MGNRAEQKQAVDLRDYLAAERTFLAWVRTGVALMGFGFVVARFGLFLGQFQFTRHAPAAQSYGVSLWFGFALIAAGVTATVFSAGHHLRVVRELDQGQRTRSGPLAPIAVAALLTLIGLAMAIYLLSLRGPATIESLKNEEAPMASATNNGIVDKASNHSVEETVEKLKALLESKGVTLFASVDHSGEAAKAGMHMPPTKLLIFGNPKAGTPLMLAAPTSAIDLPLKILVWQDNQGKVWVSYNSPEYLGQRHTLPKELLQNIAVVETLAAKAAE